MKNAHISIEKKGHSHEEYSEEKLCFLNPAIRRVFQDVQKVQEVWNMWQSQQKKLDTTDQNHWEQKISAQKWKWWNKFQETQQKSNQIADRKMCKNDKEPEII